MKTTRFTHPALAALVAASALTLGGVAHAERVHVELGAPVYVQPGFAVPVAPPTVWPQPVYGYAPPVVVQAPPPVYVERADVPPHVWHYCRDSRRYYPDVRTCVTPWQIVEPYPAS